MTEKNDEKGFVIKDRRFFDDEGKTREEAVKDEAKSRSAEAEEKPQPAEEELRAEQTPEAEETYQLPPVNFPGFILSLYTSAMFHFGDLEDPSTGKKEKNIAAAKQTIDIISMLRDKTKGNLDNNEQKLVEDLLYELQMRYVKES